MPGRASKWPAPSSQRDLVVFGHILVIDGRVVGTWRRTLTKDTVVIETSTFEELTTPEKEALAAAAERFGAFLGLRAVLVERRAAVSRK